MINHHRMQPISLELDEVGEITNPGTHTSPRLRPQETLGGV
jgi:hypothetical protein